MELLYYKINKMLWCWSLKDGARVVREAALSMDHPPPVRKELKPPPPVTPQEPEPAKTPPQPGDGLLKAIETFSRFKAWLDEPPPPPKPKPPSHAAEPEKKRRMVPSFDIQEIPGAMRRIYLPVSATLMERWFAGRLNYSPTTENEEKEINQDGMPYPQDMYDTTTVKLSWVLKFSRAKERYDQLINKEIYTERAKKTIANILSNYKKHDWITADHICKNDPILLHRIFQFQHISVDGDLSHKIGLLLKNNLERSGAPDDLTGALGSFVIYAAIGSAHFSRKPGSSSIIAKVTGIFVYVKDNYTFTDKKGNRSQYLGHWNHTGVIVVPISYAASLSSYIPYVESPVTLGDPSIRGNVFYPTLNSDFRKWAIKHQRGGDFIIYTDRHFVPLAHPIVLYL
jgi:hypothetical protein